MKLEEIKVSIIIPCYNERDYIERVIAQVKNSPIPQKEIILIDDSSSDGTKDIIKDKLESLVNKVIYHEKNQGKGAAIRSGLQAVSGDIVIIQDADLEYNPLEYPKLLKPILEDKADVVYGSRFGGSDEHRVLYFWHSIGNRVLTLLSNMFTDLNLTDMETCYKVFRRSAIENITIEEDRFGFEPEITAKISRLKCRIFEVGISYSGRTYQQGKKISWRDGLHALWCIIKYNLKP